VLCRAVTPPDLRECEAEHRHQAAAEELRRRLAGGGGGLRRAWLLDTADGRLYQVMYCLAHVYCLPPVPPAGTWLMRRAPSRLTASCLKTVSPGSPAVPLTLQGWNSAAVLGQAAAAAASTLASCLAVSDRSVLRLLPPTQCRCGAKRGGDFAKPSGHPHLLSDHYFDLKLLPSCPCLCPHSPCERH
jgi:hypothetical protein